MLQEFRIRQQWTVAKVQEITQFVNRNLDAGLSLDQGLFVRIVSKVLGQFFFVHQHPFDLVVVFDSGLHFFLQSRQISDGNLVLAIGRVIGIVEEPVFLSLAFA